MNDMTDDSSGRIGSWLYRRSATFSPIRIKPSGWLQHVPFAFWLTDVLRPENFVELGTWSGVSYSAFCQAIQMLGVPSRCFAIDSWLGDANAGPFSETEYEDWRVFHDTMFANFSTMVRSTFDDALPHFADGSIHLLHIDGCHAYEAVKHDFQQWRPKLRPDAVVLFHDTAVFEQNFGVVRLWSELAAGNLHFNFTHGNGLGVLGLGDEASYPEPLRRLLALREGSSEQTDAQMFFAALGMSVQQRFELEESVAVGARLQSDLSRHRRAIVELVEALGAATTAINDGALGLSGLKRDVGEGEKLSDPAYKLIAESALFDAAWYVEKHADVRESGLDAVEHFLRIGAPRGYSPSALFDTGKYLDLHPDVADDGYNPLLHFIQHGVHERRSIRRNDFSAYETE